MDTSELVSSTQVCEDTGVTYRRLDRWCHYGVIHAHGNGAGTGKPRSFDLGEVRVVAFVVALADLGARTGVLGHAARQVRAHPEWTGDVLVSRSGRVVPRADVGDDVSLGRACWVVALGVINANG